MLISKGDGWLLPQGELSGTQAWLFMTKGELGGTSPARPALALRGADGLDSTCAGGCDPPPARGCQPSRPAGPVP